MATAGLTFGVLGHLQVYRDGAEVPVRSARQRAALAALLLHHREPVGVDALVEATWGASLPSSPRASLHTVMSRLRALLGPGIIVNEAPGYRLLLEAGALDAEHFDELCSGAAGAGPTDALGLLDRALALWRGPVLPELSDRPFVEAEAARLTQRRVLAREDRAELQIQLGRGEAAVVDLEALVREQPLRERACGLLMRALYHAGRSTEALARFQDHRRRLVTELGLDPPPALRELQTQILGYKLPTGNEPELRPAPEWLADGTSFVGRTHELAALGDLVSQHPITTITGAPGVGKSRLAAEALGLLRRRLGTQVTVVECGAAGSEDLHLAVAASLGLGAQVASPSAIETILEYLSINPVLVVLDGCEGVRESASTLADAVLRHCPRSRLLVTSRQRLGVHAEQVLPLGPLRTVPEPGERPDTAPATELFLDRARRSRADLVVGASDLTTVAEICHRLDGLPLAVELAATRAASLGADTVLERLEQSLDLLDQAGDTGPRSLRRTLDWSYRLLTDPERRLLRVLAVFAAGFDLAAAERVVCGGLDESVETVPFELSGLVEASLVTAGGNGRTRYRLLGIVREFATEHLRRGPEEDMVRLAHARWVHECVRVAAAASTGPDDAAGAADLDDAAADVRAAVTWAIAAGRPELAGQITGTLTAASVLWLPRPETADIVMRAAAAPEVRASGAGHFAQAAAAFIMSARGDHAGAEAAAHTALAHLRTEDERYLTLLTLGVSTLYAGRLQESRGHWEALLAIDGLGPARRASGLASLALVALYSGDLAAAHRFSEEAGWFADAGGAVAIRSFARYAAGEVAAADDLASAVPYFLGAAEGAEQAGAVLVSGLARTALLAALTRLGDHRQALGVAVPLLDHWLRQTAWPQLWTTMRTLAELMAQDRPEVAALVLAAADHADSAPAVTGAYLEQQAFLESGLRARVGASTYARIRAVAPVVTRVQLVDRVRATATELLAAAARAR